MVRNRVLIVIVVRVRLQRIAQQRAAVKRRGQPRRDGALFDVRSKDKRSRAAAENVGGRGLGEGAAVAGEVEGAVLDGAWHDAPLGLGVDGELLARVFGVDLVDVRLVVAIEEVVVEHDTVVWAEGAQGPAVVALDQLAPACAIRGALGAEAVTDGLEAVGGHARDMLGSAGGVGEGQGDWQADEVDVADVGEDLAAVEGEFAEAKVGVEVRVRWVGDGGFDESWAGVEEEGQSSVYGEPKTGTGEPRDRDRPAVAWSTEGNGTIGLQGLLGGGRGVGIVGSLPIGLEQKDPIAVIDGGAGNVGVDSAGSCLVLQRDAESRVRHDES